MHQSARAITPAVTVTRYSRLRRKIPAWRGQAAQEPAEVPGAQAQPQHHAGG